MQSVSQTFDCIWNAQDSGHPLVGMVLNVDVCAVELLVAMRSDLATPAHLFLAMIHLL